MNHHHIEHHSQPHHQDHHAAAQAEHKIMDNLLKHHSNSEITKELNHLRDLDRKSGRDFSKDLRYINQLLHSDLAKHHLPSLTITDNGKDFQIKPEQPHENRFNQL